MSEQVVETGLLVPTGDNLYNFMVSNFDQVTFNYYDIKVDDLIDCDIEDVRELFMENFLDEYIEYNNEVYKVVDYHKHDNFDIFQASMNNDGLINFTVSYYNGGRGFSEAVVEALDNIKEVK